MQGGATELLMHYIKQMGYLVFSTPNPQECAADLAQTMGIEQTSAIPGAATLSSNERLFEVVYLPGEKKGVLSIGLEAMDAAAVETVRERLRKDGAEILSDEPSVPGVERAVRFRAPGGPILEVHTPVPRRLGPVLKPHTWPKRLEHVNMYVPDPRAFTEMALSVLGMEITERTSEYEFVWLRAGDGYHHTIALGRGGGHLQHYAFDGEVFESIVTMSDALSVRDRSLIWGVGRHGAGHNLFAYYKDPLGVAVECSVGQGWIDHSAPFEPRITVLTPDSRLRNLWGPIESPEYRSAGAPFLAAA